MRIAKLDHPSSIESEIHDLIHGLEHEDLQHGSNSEDIPHRDSDHLGQLGELLNAPVSIVVAGTMNHGKSSLLNALLGKQDRFPVADARTTVANAREAWRDGVDFVDTPGTEADLADEAEASRLHQAADLVLFCHSIKDGELQSPEIQLLERVYEWFPRVEYRKQCVIPVFTKVDDKEEAEARQIVGRCLEQFEEFLGTRPMHHQLVSSPRYWRGVEANRPRLVELSGILNLRTWLEGRLDRLKVARKTLLLERISGHLDTLYDELTQRLENLNSRKEARKREADLFVIEALSEAHEVCETIDNHSWLALEETPVSYRNPIFSEEIMGCVEKLMRLTP